MSLKTPILIIGGGPVGLMLALFLDYYSIPCTIINTGTSSRIHPKGNGQNARTMEHYRQLGFSDEIRKLGLPDDHPFDQAFFTRFGGFEIYRYECASLNERKERRRKGPVTDQFVEPMYHVNQMYVEAFLFEKVKQCVNVDVRFGWEAVSFSQDDNGVTLRARKVDSDPAEEVTFTADYMVDCSGGKSFIRKQLGIEYVGDVQTQDAFMAGQFYTVWLKIPELYPKYLGHRRAWMYWAINEDKETRGILVSLNGKDEFEMMVKATEKGKGVDADEVKRWVEKAIGDSEIKVEVISHAPWTAGAALAVEQYRSGRIFLAGDSAHLFTPVGAFGMNTGIDSVHNLAWKFAATIQGWAGPDLLDSYEIERRPIGFKNTSASRAYSTKWQDPHIPPELEEDSAEGEAARRKLAQTSAYITQNHFCVPEDEDCTGVQLGARYDSSPLVIRDEGEEPPEEKWPETYDVYHPSGVPGGRLPHVWLDEKRDFGSSVYDQLGSGFALLHVSENQDVAGLDRLLEATARRGVPLEVLRVDVPEALQLWGRRFVLVRPDRYICWRGDELLEDVNGLLDRVLGFR